ISLFFSFFFFSSSRALPDLHSFPTRRSSDLLMRRHATHFLAFAEEAEPHLRERPGEWLERLEREHNNLRGALDRFSAAAGDDIADRKSTRLNSSHVKISYAVFCLKKKKKKHN